jgi:tetratricopeptide (TPR) repeat protein
MRAYALLLFLLSSALPATDLTLGVVGGWGLGSGYASGNVNNKGYYFNDQGAASIGLLTDAVFGAFGIRTQVQYTYKAVGVKYAYTYSYSEAYQEYDPCYYSYYYGGCYGGYRTKYRTRTVSTTGNELMGVELFQVPIYFRLVIPTKHIQGFFEAGPILQLPFRAQSSGVNSDTRINYANYLNELATTGLAIGTGFDLIPGRNKITFNFTYESPMYQNIGWNNGIWKFSMGWGYRIWMPESEKTQSRSRRSGRNLDETTRRLISLRNMRQEGLISMSEYQARKENILQPDFATTDAKQVPPPPAMEDSSPLPMTPPLEPTPLPKPPLDLDLVRQMYASKQYKQCADSTSALLTEYPESLELHLYLGHSLYALGQTQEAVRQYKQAIRLDSSKTLQLQQWLKTKNLF